MPRKPLIRGSRKAIVMAFLFLLAVNNGKASTCAVDLNGNQKLTEQGETATCIGTTQGDLCPIGAVDCNVPKECPLDQTLPCDSSNMCSQTVTTQTQGTCIQPDVTQPSWQCVETGLFYLWPQQPSLSQGFCEANCTTTTSTVNTAACVDSTPTCPLGSGYACMDNSGTFQCSNNACSNTAPVLSPVDTSMLVDDGAKNADGSCAAQINIFAGRPMECKTSGLESAFRNCCDEGSNVMQDDVSGASFLYLGVETAQLLYTASTAAWAVYETAIAAGATQAAATGAATNYFTAVVAASGPTILATAAVAALIYYYQTACTNTDLETSNMAKSGFCHKIGTHCINKWATGCVQEARVYCCFNSKIGRIIHEQGRPQLNPFAGISGSVFGTPDYPECRGFDQNELQALDFGQIDLSEYFNDVMNAANTSNAIPAMKVKINEKIQAVQ